ncbi:Crp/Fnr family transcriptional regulator [Chitinophaga nivalis]|uniref:Crp/Fnr family transcriptional regulator n=1 Tax=Chitinophaga nivalis TaxID=2991709 RepID=A0ABT3IJX2_9BACT|nr:Crp/Fnr family transcriptional regulator [Chitinophaga nivalis]MCW3466057.1 Crp/Fnr family transcriptional regulator [Chitinophaga nivalis]MCW3484252.1 Crp/Fnr family transcriptional regulator [Chitinophaga nivalis]
MYDLVLSKMDAYYPLSEACQQDLMSLFKYSTIKKDDYLLRMGTVPGYYYFIVKGLFAYYYIAANGDVIIKKFFAENSFVASTSALIEQKPGLFSIVALEDAEYIRFAAKEFRDLFRKHHDLAMFQINYLEKNWIVDKENGEISLKYETAKERYIQFLETYHDIQGRIKLHHIASFLGITPTQLSRIRKDMDF